MRDGWDGCHMKVERECGRVSFDLKVRIMEMMSARYEKLWKSLMILMKENRLSASDWLLANSWPPVRCAYWGILSYFRQSVSSLWGERSLGSSLWKPFSQASLAFACQLECNEEVAPRKGMSILAVMFMSFGHSGYKDNSVEIHDVEQSDHTSD